MPPPNTQVGAEYNTINTIILQQYKTHPIIYVFRKSPHQGRASECHRFQYVGRLTKRSGKPVGVSCAINPESNRKGFYFYPYVIIYESYLLSETEICY